MLRSFNRYNFLYIGQIGQDDLSNVAQDVYDMCEYSHVKKIEVFSHHDTPFGYCRVVAIDQRGYGDSDKPSGIYNYTREKLSQDIKQLIPALGEAFIINSERGICLSEIHRVT